MSTLLKLAVAAVIIAATYYALVRVAEEKANALAGGATYPLGPQAPEEWRAFEALLERLDGWGEEAFARRLAEVQESGDLMVAPGLTGGRSAVYVSSLGLVSRVFVSRGELLPRELPFPELDIPEPAQRTFAALRLAGTLYHELQHRDGLEDERETYEREIEWYADLGERMMGQLPEEDQREFEWAVESAIETAVAAQEKAGRQPGASAATPSSQGAGA